MVSQLQGINERIGALGESDDASFVEFSSKALIPDFPGHYSYHEYRVLRFEDCLAPSVTRICHEVALVGGDYSLEVLSSFQGHILDELDMQIVRGDFSIFKTTLCSVRFDMMNSLLGVWAGSLRLYAGRDADVSELALCDLHTVGAFARRESPCVVLNGVFEDMMASYESLCRADKHLCSLGDLEREFSLLRNYLVAVLGESAGVPLFLDSMARNGALFVQRVAGFRKRWADLRSVSVAELSYGDAADRWCDALKCIRFAFCVYFGFMMVLRVALMMSVCVGGSPGLLSATSGCASWSSLGGLWQSTGTARVSFCDTPWSWRSRPGSRASLRGVSCLLPGEGGRYSYLSRACVDFLFILLGLG